MIAQGVQGLLQNKTLAELKDPALIAAAQEIARKEVMTLADLTNSATMKTHLVGVLLERAMHSLAA
jgi:CO/xanthine dehydrogenase FAD-binding subunit